MHTLCTRVANSNDFSTCYSALQIANAIPFGDYSRVAKLCHFTIASVTI